MNEADQSSDQELIAAANRGDARAFEQLYHRHREWVSGLAFRMTGNNDLALDVVQETFIYLLGKLPNLQLTARMTTFLYPVVKNLSINARRKSSRISGDDILGDIPAPELPDNSVDDLAAAMQILPAAQRETLLMRYVDDMSMEEIAEALEIPVGTVKSRIHQALSALRENPRTRGYFGT
jgi:RNA polymerase sigma-70 factor, ECF subfamily